MIRWIARLTQSKLVVDEVHVLKVAKVQALLHQPCEASGWSTMVRKDRLFDTKQEAQQSLIPEIHERLQQAREQVADMERVMHQATGAPLPHMEQEQHTELVRHVKDLQAKAGEQKLRLSNQSWIRAIQYVRQQTGMNLIDAKNFVTEECGWPAVAQPTLAKTEGEA